MPTFRVRTDDGRVIDDVIPQTLRPLLIDGTDAFVLEQVKGTAESDRVDGSVAAIASARAVPLESGRWQIELTDRSDRRTGNLPNGEAAYDALRSWAANDEWWREAFTWS